MKKTIFFLFFFIYYISSSSFLKKRQIIRSRLEWQTTNPERQTCWWSCTKKNGFSCGFGVQGRATSDFYICAKDQRDCKDWLDSYVSEDEDSGKWAAWRIGYGNMALSVYC